VPLVGNEECDWLAWGVVDGGSWLRGTRGAGEGRDLWENRGTLGVNRNSVEGGACVQDKCD